MPTTFFTSDTHFGHSRLLEKAERPFADADEMDDHIVSNWNSVVGPNDLVWHLGDFAVSADAEKVSRTFARLNGRKRLVLGNHDYIRPGVIDPNIAALAWDAPPRDFVETLTDHEQRLVLCHYPLRSWPGQKKGSFHFFGHAHGDTPDLGHSRDVGVDLADVAFTPRTFEELTCRLVGRLQSPLPAR